MHSLHGHRTSWHLVLGLLLGLPALFGGCSSSDDDPPPVDTTPRLVAAFDASKGELPEGLAIHGGAGYVGFAPSGVVARIDLQNGSFQSFAKLPSPVPNQGFMTGLAFDGAGSFYGALVSFTKDVAPGIYRTGPNGGDATLFAEHPDMIFPNGLAFDAQNRLWVTDSTKGALFRIDPNGTVTLVSDDALLRGQKGFCGPGTDPGFDVGANGIALGDSVVYIANSDKASIVEVRLNPDGSALSALRIAGPRCDTLGGADGLVRTPNGRALVVAANRLNQLVRIGLDGSIDVLRQGAPFDFPASLVVSTDGNASTLWVTSFALASATSGSNPRPGLVRLGIAN